jgi:hypothetical protein
MGPATPGTRAHWGWTRARTSHAALSGSGDLWRAHALVPLSRPHAPPLPPCSAPMSRAMTHAPLSCISWSHVHSLSLGNLLQDPRAATHRSDRRSWSAIGFSLQLGEGPAALCLLPVLRMRAFPRCGCRRGRRVLLLVGCHCPASEFLPRAASELGGLVLLVCTGSCSSHARRTHRAGGVPLLKAPLGLLHVAHPCRRPHAVHRRLDWAERSA